MQNTMDSTVYVSRDGTVTNSLATIREVLTHRYCQHSITTESREDALDARFSHRSFGTSSLNYLRYGARVRIQPREFETFYMVHVPISGTAMLTIDNQDVEIARGMALVVSPSSRVATRWSADCGQLMVQFSKERLETVLSEMILQPIRRPVRFERPFDFSTAPGSNFHGLLRYLSDAFVESDAIYRSKLLSEQFERTLLMMLLTGFRHSYSDAVEAIDQPACPRHVARAYDFMIARAEEPITLQDITKASGVSQRALHDGFKRFKGASPMACLRAIRMQHARQALLEAEEGADVTQIAHRCGFLHMGRFAKSYHDIFKERPSQTLRKAAGRA